LIKRILNQNAISKPDANQLSAKPKPDRSPNVSLTSFSFMYLGLYTLYNMKAQNKTAQLLCQAVQVEMAGVEPASETLVQKYLQA